MFWFLHILLKTAQFGFFLLGLMIPVLGNTKNLDPKNTYFAPVLQTFIPQESSLQNENSQTCGLKKFQNATFTQQNDNPFQTEGVRRSTTNIALFETTDPSCLKKFGIVQYIKGCVYNSHLDMQTGRVNKWFGHVRSYKGKQISYNHPDWEVDTIDEDPLYWSSEDYLDQKTSERLASYLTPLKKWEFAKTPEKLWQQFRFFDRPKNNLKTLLENPQPVYPVLAATDLPVGSSFSFDEATNVSLQFKTCLYEMDKIPLVGEPTLETSTGPIHCFEWSHNHVYNHQFNVFEETQEIDPFCSEATNK